MFIAGCTVAAIGVWRREHGHAFFVAGILSALAQFAAVAAFMLAGRGDDWPTLALVGFECLVNGLGSAILAAGGVMLLGRVFGITTTWQLLELANPTHPLLRRLMSEAPGTYHHSLSAGTSGILLPRRWQAPATLLFCREPGERREPARLVAA